MSSASFPGLGVIAVGVLVALVAVFNGKYTSPVPTTAAGPTLPKTTVVTLPFISVEGFVLKESEGVSLPTDVLAWFSIPYAAPPTQERRFAFPQSPLKQKNTLRLKEYGPVCMQPLAAWAQSEDCLTLSIFAPANTKPNAGLPVVIWVPGGAFNVGAGRGFNLASMISNAPAPFIGVSINYRLGALGFLPSTLTRDANLLNLGFADQRRSFAFVSQYIKSFGGDPNRVTIMGESAGAHSIGYHLLHEDAGATKLFNQVIMDSGGPTARAFPNYTYPLYEMQMAEFLWSTGCEEANAQEVFDCLRRLDVGVLMGSSFGLYKKYYGSMQWPFQPVQDFKYVKGPASESWARGAFQKVNILTGFNSDEGSLFVPEGLQTDDDFRGFWKTLLPNLSDEILDTIERLYPSPDAPDSPYSNSIRSHQFSRMNDAYGDFAYIAQVQNNAIESAKWAANGGITYKYHFAQLSAGAPVHYKVYHLSELAYVACVNLTEPEDRMIGRKMNAYYASFIVTGDPNILMPPGAKVWPPYQTGDQRQLRFGGGAVDGVAVEKDDIRREACDFWRSIPKELHH